MSQSEAAERIELAVFESRLAALCETMGAVLRRSAFSPNIRDRLDFSCALFDAGGALLNQATHIPVHLGSMAWAMRDLVDRFDWRPGHRLILNDPFAGGTHLPDVTLIAPVFHGEELVGFVANRAHHADIGSETPGSMPLSGTLADEGVLIEPTWLYRDGVRVDAAFEAICAPMRDPALAGADFQAQVAASASGERALTALLDEYGPDRFRALCDGLNAYAERLAAAALAALPGGVYRAEDAMDDDGAGGPGPVLRVAVEVGDDGLRVDFAGTDPAVPGNLNCPMSVTAAAVFYVVRCLLPAATPACAGAMARLALDAPVGCLVNAQRPSATAAGNVETSQRIVDVLLRALALAVPGRIPAASQGTMNNLGLGSARWSYYETQAGGCGASAGHPGRSAVHSHMTNTLNTPAEVLERRFPLRLVEYRIRRGSGGEGRRRGGDGLIRTFEFLEPAEVTLITERRRLAPWGLEGGGDGLPGENRLDDRVLPAKVGLRVEAGQRLRIETPGGGGYGAPGP
ncbi:hydantoinase B/oxoprolinase family protein [Wenzhouxiangella sp. XN79A]|uniref:hydantoinase B/oxoprolinase family protein n=1 Tax=Wenzhouxiangella sp. XN79A TaxID=2724193 RepID=UPI00144A53D4|nr:hydantoinase B/oxoprolinase family protein [Wenzhouxiangella sp. XN79A]NKI35406.1 hydantoinase B/oxoprolinase family protein [Wenzhouxiangella sp. XN79A]